MTSTTLHATQLTADDDVALKPTAAVMLVTPELAQSWLSRNRRNRPLRKAQVAKYARSMARGAWQITGEAIKFDNNGDIIDGQHRLHAVIEAGEPILIFVVRGLAPSAQDVMDTGIKRKAGDALGLNGYRNASNLAASARLAITYEAGQIRHAAQQYLIPVSNDEIMDFVLAHPDLEGCVSMAQGAWRSIPTQRSVIGFVYYVLHGIDAEAARTFLQDLAEGRTDGAGDPRSTLLKRLHNMQRDRSREGAITHAHLIFRTWNAVRAGEHLSQLKIVDGQEFARPR